jgi:hypothetical protein
MNRYYICFWLKGDALAVKDKKKKFSRKEIVGSIVLKSKLLPTKRKKPRGSKPYCFIRKTLESILSKTLL